MLLNHSPRQSVNIPSLLRHVSATPKDRQADSDLARFLTDKRDGDKRPMELTFCREMVSLARTKEPYPIPKRARNYGSHGLTLDSLTRVPGEISEPEDGGAPATPQVVPNQLLIHPGLPTTLNELQFRISRDFCFIWRFFIDDPMTWRYPSMAFNTIAIGLLRIAAWDLEVSSDSQIHYPENRVNFPYWDAPQTDIFWFHGYLVVLHGNINTKSSILAAISKAQFFLEVSHKDAAHLIILSLQHVAFVEVSSKFNILRYEVLSTPFPAVGRRIDFAGTGSIAHPVTPVDTLNVLVKQANTKSSASNSPSPMLHFNKPLIPIVVISPWQREQPLACWWSVVLSHMTQHPIDSYAIISTMEQILRRLTRRTPWDKPFTRRQVNVIPEKLKVAPMN
ncbi:hypothetical protein CIHG_09906 [Coccidioides immitis H538.4]|uniref:Uncharacterized protein n=1 Tax=Coccidioides immitis H538.4 TaxID=396776 RepID=A0A0J8UVY9_COCIT|nr:hypothetical protein CIHG_09906 [Coccidioides immitis H538.4]